MKPLRQPVSPGHGQGTSPASGGQQPPHVPATLKALCLVLILVAGAILVQAVLLHLNPAPAVVNTSAPSSPDLTRDRSVPPTVSISISREMIQDKTTTRTTGTPVTIPSGRSSREVTVINATYLEKRIHDLVNLARQEHGQPLLTADPALASLARAHSADMASKGYFGHVNLDERDPTARGAAAGYRCHKGSDTESVYAIAENIFATYRSGAIIMVNGREIESDGKPGEAIAEETVDAWMNSPDHRDNILDPGMGREGIGVAFGQGDMVFVTQDFC